MYTTCAKYSSKLIYICALLKRNPFITQPRARTSAYVCVCVCARARARACV